MRHAGGVDDHFLTLADAADTGIRGEWRRRALVLGLDAIVRLVVAGIIVRALATADWSADDCASGEVCSEVFPGWLLLVPLLAYALWNAGVVVAIGARLAAGRSGRASRNDVMLLCIGALARLLWLVPLSWRKADDWPVLILLLGATVLSVLLAVALGMRRPMDQSPR